MHFFINYTATMVTVTTSSEHLNNSCISICTDMFPNNQEESLPAPPKPKKDPIQTGENAEMAFWKLPRALKRGT